MAVKGQFGTSLNELTRIPNLRNRYCRDTWIWRGMTIDRRWRNGDAGGTGKFIVHFEAGQRSSIQGNGDLVPDDKMAQPTYVRGSIDHYKRFATAVSINQEDVWQQMAPRLRETYITMRASTEMERNKKNFMHQLTWNMLNGPKWMVSSTAAPGSTGQLTVDTTANTTIGERLDVVRMDTSGSNAGKVTQILRDQWVSAIDVNAKKISLVTTRGGTTKSSLSTYTTATGSPNTQTFLALPGVVTGNGFLSPTAVSGVLQPYVDGGFTSLRQQVFSQSKGAGSDFLFGQEKIKYPYLQSLLTDGSGVSNRKEFLKVIVDAYMHLVKEGQPIGVAPGNSAANTEDGSMSIMSRNVGRVQAVMSLDWFRVLQDYFMEARSAYFKQTTGTRIDYYDASSFTFMGVEGTRLDAVGVKAMPNDVIYIIGTNALRFATLDLIKTYRSFDGIEWFIKRGNSTGREYILDLSFYGDLILQRPAGVAGIYGLPSNPSTAITTQGA